jgi:hypothetical protein
VRFPIENENGFQYSEFMKILLRVAWIVLASSFILAQGAWAHGTEREYGTVINGRSAGSQFSSGGSPDFTLIAIEANVGAMLRAAEGGEYAELKERASQLFGQIEELQHRSEGLEPANREFAAEAAAEMEEVALRVGLAARASDVSSLRHEIDELKRSVGSMQSFLRRQSDKL